MKDGVLYSSFTRLRGATEIHVAFRGAHVSGITPVGEEGEFVRKVVQWYDAIKRIIQPWDDAKYYPYFSIDALPRNCEVFLLLHYYPESEHYLNDSIRFSFHSNSAGVDELIGVMQNMDTALRNEVNSFFSYMDSVRSEIKECPIHGSLERVYIIGRKDWREDERRITIYAEDEDVNDEWKIRVEFRGNNHLPVEVLKSALSALRGLLSSLIKVTKKHGLSTVELEGEFYTEDYTLSKLQASLIAGNIRASVEETLRADEWQDEKLFKQRLKQCEKRLKEMMEVSQSWVRPLQKVGGESKK